MKRAVFFLLIKIDKKEGNDNKPKQNTKTSDQ